MLQGALFITIVIVIVYIIKLIIYLINKFRKKPIQPEKWGKSKKEYKGFFE